MSKLSDFSSTQIKAAIEEIAKDISVLDQEEDEYLAAKEIVAQSTETVEDLGSAKFRGLFSLADRPISEWDETSVCPASKIGDSNWDFSAYPHVRRKGTQVNWDYENSWGINLKSNLNVHWFRIVAALTFYRIPHFSVSGGIRSYAGLGGTKIRNSRVTKLFKEFDLYGGPGDSFEFRTLNEISTETIKDYCNRIDSLAERWEVAHVLRFWYDLSDAGLLPTEYCLIEAIHSKTEISKLRAAMDAIPTTWEPILLDDYVDLVAHAIRTIEVLSPDILWLYKTYFRSITKREDAAHLYPDSVTTGSAEGAERFRNYQCVQVNGEPWWPLQIIQRKNGATAVPYNYGSTEFIDRWVVATLINSLVDACCLQVFATTGMRRTELATLKTKCLRRDKRGAWLTFVIWKTSDSAKGDIKKIPITELTARALEILDELCEGSRTVGKHDYLISGIHNANFGMPVYDGNTIDRGIKRMADSVGIEYSVHPHRFRKSLAMFLIYQDSASLELINLLFSHKSLKMTLRYILALPGVSDEVKRIVVEQNVDILHEVLTAALKNRIGGIGGSRVKANLENAPAFKARLQDQGKETLVTFVESILDQGISLLHRTNMAICLRTAGIAESAPCDGKYEGAAEKYHPNVHACDPLNCNFAAFVEADVPALKSEIVFHDKLTRHSFTSADQLLYSQRRIEQAFRRLEEVNGQEAELFLQKVANGGR
jgi:hypothetical protein